MSGLNQTNIPWATRTWSPGRGCLGCEVGPNCWALKTCWRMAHNSNPKVAEQFEGLVQADYDHLCRRYRNLRWTGAICTYPEAFDAPVRARNPQVIFVWPHGDIAHADAETIRRVFGVALDCEEHEFLFLTKQPGLLLEKLRRGKTSTGETLVAVVQIALTHALGVAHEDLSHIWVGVSAGGQAEYDERVSALCDQRTGWPGRKWVSLEPMMESVNLGWWAGSRQSRDCPGKHGHAVIGCPLCNDTGKVWKGGIEWVVAGSADTLAHKAAQFTPEIARSIRDQCREAGIPFWLKQGAWQPYQLQSGITEIIAESHGALAPVECHEHPPSRWVEHAPCLDGRQWQEAPPAIAAILRRERKLPWARRTCW